MKDYWYVETIFDQPYQQMIVSQEALVDTPHILIYEDDPNNPAKMWMNHYPVFEVEYVLDKNRWEKMESLMIYLPDNAIVSCISIYYDDEKDNFYPPGFREF